MSKKNPYHWAVGFPEFNMAHRFTYFNDLANTKHNSYTTAYLKHNLYQNAVSAVNSTASFLTQPSNFSELESALNFLQAAAESERKKELAAITHYKDELKKQLPKHKDVDKILNQLNTSVLDDPQTLNNFYAQLTECINLIRQAAVDYKKELQKLAAKSTKTFAELTEQDYRFRLPSDVQAMLNNLIGTATQKQKRDETVYATNLRTVIGDYMIKKNIPALISSGEDFAAIMVAITIDIEKLMQTEMDKRGKKDFKNFTLKEMQEIVQQYTERDISEQTRLQRAIDEQSSDLTQIISGAKNILGIKSLEDASAITKRRRSVAAKLSHQTEQSSLMKRLQKEVNLDQLLQELKLVEFTHKTSTSHGNLNELIQILYGGATSKVGGMAATDTITIGSANFFMDDSGIYEAIQNYVQKISEAFTQYSKEQRKSRMKDRTKEFDAMNKTVEKAEQEIDNLLANLNVEINDLFIYHESLKLYASVETGRERAFHGRSMTILSFLDELYSLNGLGGLVLPQQDAMVFLALNLSELAVGGEIKDPLAKYFSLFAGLMMFDDVKNIALEASQQVSYNTIKNIHLYNLNGIYVPASMILTYTYQAAIGAYEEITSGRAASTNISTSKATAVINEWLTNNHNYRNSSNPGNSSFKDDWPKVAEGTASGTIVQITFLASFLQLIQDLISI